MAYVGNDGSVYFSISSYQKAGFVYPKFRTPSVCNEEPADRSVKRDQRDFALWKADRADGCFWSSPWGVGRPGWHIECSSMIDSVFKEDIDWHSGGIDLEFPHHENEIAQSEAYYNHTPWCPQFTHLGHVYLDKEKMSKSLGNTISMGELLTKYEPDDFRMLCLLSDYHESLEFSDERLVNAAFKRKRLLDLISNLSNFTKRHGNAVAQRMDEVDSSVLFR
jgi:cysteinyl-tRNA synthetase